MIRSAYARTLNAAGRLADRSGIAGRLERRPGRTAFYVRSLFAIHDVHAMLRLDTPWWTFDAIGRVDQFLAERGGDARIFEFGAGASTVWLAARAGDVHSVEHDADFATLIGPPARDAGATLHVVPPVPSADPPIGSGRRGERGRDFSEYVATIGRVGGQFDLIVIDGRARVAALERAIPHLAVDGMVVFDDAHRRRYHRGLATSGLRIERTIGLAPGLPYPSCTALAWHGSPARDAF